MRFIKAVKEDTVTLGLERFFFAAGTLKKPGLGRAFCGLRGRRIWFVVACARAADKPGFGGHCDL
jgi:hypothetical protein